MTAVSEKQYDRLILVLIGCALVLVSIFTTMGVQVVKGGTWSKTKMIQETNGDKLSSTNNKK